jgi:hypothetical protein
MTTDDARLARLQQHHAARWDTWTARDHARTTWNAKPAGTHAAVHHEDTASALDTWIRRVDAITASGITIAFHHGHDITATATWTPPGTRTPATYGPAPVPEVLDHAEDIRARRRGMIQWLNDDPEGTARHMADAQIQDLIPDVPDESARRVLQAITTQRAATRQPAALQARPPAPHGSQHHPASKQPREGEAAQCRNTPSRHATPEASPSCKPGSPPPASPPP